VLTNVAFAFVQVPTTCSPKSIRPVGRQNGGEAILAGKNLIGALPSARPLLIGRCVNPLPCPFASCGPGSRRSSSMACWADAPFFDWLEAHMDGFLASDPKALLVRDSAFLRD